MCKQAELVEEEAEEIIFHASADNPDRALKYPRVLGPISIDKITVTSGKIRFYSNGDVHEYNRNV